MVIPDQDPRTELHIQQEPQERGHEEVGNPKRFRRRRKVPRPAAYHPGELAEMRARGEWPQGDDEEELEEKMEEEVAKLRLLQHWSLQQMVQEEVGQICENSESDCMLLNKSKRGVEELERIMNEEEKGVKRAKLKSLTVTVEEDVVQTRIIPLDEVRQDLEAWKPAFEKEVNTLVGGPVKPVTKEEFQRLRDTGEKIEILPMLAIAPKKPPNKR